MYFDSDILYLCINNNNLRNYINITWGTNQNKKRNKDKTENNIELWSLLATARTVLIEITIITAHCLKELHPLNERRYLQELNELKLKRNGRALPLLSINW